MNSTFMAPTEGLHESGDAPDPRILALGRLSLGVVHDMKNVLGAIMGLAGVAMEQADPPLQPALQGILQACLRGRDSIQGLLRFARGETCGKSVADLNRVVGEISHLLALASKADVRYHLDLDPDLGVVAGDEGSLSMAVMNISLNSLDAMPQGGTLSFRTRNLGDATVAVSIVDTGEGMSQEVLARATDLFFTTKPAGKGTGLGLAQVRDTVQAHRGNLILSSEIGKGTQAHLMFPRAANA